MKRRVALFSLLLLILLPLLQVNSQNIHYIENEDELFMLEKDPSGIYYLIDDITVTESHTTQFSSKENSFTGVLDGNGHKISFCEIKGEGDVVAFIGYSSGEIKNLNFVKANIETQNSNAVAAGIVAQNYGVISGCSFTGNVKKCGSSLLGFGIFGYNHGRVKDNNDGAQLSDGSGNSVGGGTELLGPSASSDNEIISSTTEIPSEVVSSTVEENKFIFDGIVDDNPQKDDTAAVVLVLICVFLIGVIVILAIIAEIKELKNRKNEK